MIEIDVRGMRDVQRLFSGLAQEQIPYAQMIAINEVAFKVKRAEQDEMQRVFSSPIHPWILRQIAVRKASKQTLTAVIGTPEGLRDIRGNQRRLDWFGVFDRTVRAELPGAAANAVQRAIDTAR